MWCDRRSPDRLHYQFDFSKPVSFSFHLFSLGDLLSACVYVGIVFGNCLPNCGQFVFFGLPPFNRSRSTNNK